MKETAKDLFELESAEMTRQMAKSGGVTIAEHNRALSERAKALFELHYIDRDIYELLCMACKYHDLGKANPRMQERLEHAELKFDPDQEIHVSDAKRFFSGVLYRPVCGGISSRLRGCVLAAGRSGETGACGKTAGAVEVRRSSGQESNKNDQKLHCTGGDKR